jgi:C_GCAxxG_C_C family probable redox protein
VPDERPCGAAEAADRYFQEGLNCAQAVLRAVAEARGLECPACIPAVALGMGGGIGHTGRACGALTGGVMAIGLAVDRKMAAAPITDRKGAACRLAGRLVEAFASHFGSSDCSALLGFAWTEPGAVRRFERENLKAARCTVCVRWAAAEADRLLGG